jgi:hypothetical protein
MEESLNKILLKPRFKCHVSHEPDEILQIFKDNLNNPDCKYCGKISKGHIFIDIPNEEQKIWSPQLEVVVEKEGTQTTIKGLFAPKPTFWTFFIFLHFVLGVGFFIFLALAYANSVAGNDSTLWYYGMGSMIILWILLYVLGQYGKMKAKVQMEDLRNFLRKSLEKLNIV